MLPGRRSYRRPPLKQPVAAFCCQYAPMRPMLRAVGQHHSFGQLPIVRKTAELGGVPVRMHHSHRCVVVPQQVTALGKLLQLVAHALE